MRILVTGGTGMVGSEVVRQLAGTHEVRVLTRDPSKARRFPSGVTAVAGDLREPATVRRLFDGIDAVFLLNPVSQTEANEGLMAVSAMRGTGVTRVVYVSVQDADRAPWLPHFGSKVGVETAIQKSGIPYTILRPNNFYQNDYWFKDVLLRFGVYPQPIGDVGLSRVDTRDIAEAAAVALTTSDHEGQTYDLAGPEPLTGETTAAAWARALGKPVKYAGNDLDAWEGQSLKFMPDWMVYDFRHMYAFFQQEGLVASAESAGRQAKLLGHAPRSFGAFAAETAAGWMADR